MSDVKYRRILLKLGGEALAGPDGFGIDPTQAEILAAKVKRVYDLGVQVAVVIGAGNLWRGKQGLAHGMERTTADHMGMLATVMNALALRDALQARHLPARVLSAVPMGGLCESYVRARAVRHLEKGRFVILAAGTGSPFFTTDTCSALRASELGAEVLLKATKVDGVFETDPVTCPDARKFDRLTYGEVLARRLGVMDLAAVSLCMDSRIPVIVFRLSRAGNLAAAVRGEPVGTTISTE